MLGVGGYGITLGLQPFFSGISSMKPNYTLHAQGWISVTIFPEQESSAQRMRERRDIQYRNIYAESASDMRWVGELGEIGFDAWLKHGNSHEHQWVLDNAASQPDFVLSSGITVDVKTVKRTVPPIMSYTAQITARHAQEPHNHYFFMSYENINRRLWFLGGISREQFLAESRFYSAGEWVHPNYQVRSGHEIYNIGISKLTPPNAWISSVNQV